MAGREERETKIVDLKKSDTSGIQTDKFLLARGEGKIGGKQGGGNGKKKASG